MLVCRAILGPSTCIAYRIYFLLFLQTLSNLLKTTPDGRSILKEAEKDEPLGENLRKQLVHIIAKDIVRADPQASVTANYSHWITEISMY